LTGEGQGEGEESRNFNKLFIPLPFIPSRQGRGNLTFYEFINLDELVKCRHSRAGGNPESMKLIEKTGFPFSRE
jgi:hypothetical protein